NDKNKHADQIKKLLKGIPCKINLIPYNETTENFQRPPDDDILMFAEYLKTMHATVTLRLSKGDDIQGACGQLVVKKQRRRK
ncbi:23S rRNA (adenine(2503)-C(2))-methyltransferase RlmN, partial [candidate division KSB1 bacterium]